MWWKLRPCISQYFNMTLIPADLLGMQHCFCFSFLSVELLLALLALSTRTVCISQSGPQVGILPAIEYISFSFLPGRDIITLSLCTHWAYCEKILGPNPVIFWFPEFTDGFQTQWCFWITRIGVTLGWLEFYLIIFRGFCFSPSPLQASFTLGNKKPGRELHGAWRRAYKIFLKGSSYSLVKGNWVEKGPRGFNFNKLYSS